MLLLLAFVAVLTGCSGKDIGYQYDPNKPTPDVEQLPLYPGATDVQERGVAGLDQEIAYKAPVSCEDVLSYYRSTLPNDGWSPRGVAKEPNAIYMHWQNGRNNPYYRLDVTVSALSPSMCQVRLKLLAQPIE